MIQALCKQSQSSNNSDQLPSFTLYLEPLTALQQNAERTAKSAQTVENAWKIACVQTALQALQAKNPAAAQRKRQQKRRAQPKNQRPRRKAQAAQRRNSLGSTLTQNKRRHILNVIRLRKHINRLHLFQGVACFGKQSQVPR